MRNDTAWSLACVCSQADRPPIRQPVSSTATSGAAHLDAPHAVQQLHTFAISQAQLLLQHRQKRLQHRSQLGAGRSQRLRTLQRVLALHPRATMLTRADVDGELPVDRLLWQIDLILHILVADFQSLAAAIRTALGQRHDMSFGDLGRVRRLTMGFGPVVVAGFAAGPLGGLFGWSFGERRRLPLAAPRQLLDDRLQFLDGLLQAGNAALQAGVLGQQLVVTGVWRHPDHPWTSCNATQPAVNRRACQAKSLNKYTVRARAGHSDISPPAD